MTLQFQLSLLTKIRFYSFLIFLFFSFNTHAEKLDYLYKDILKAALENSYEIKINDSEVSKKGAKEYSSFATKLPQLSVEPFIKKENEDNIKEDTHGVTFSANWPIYKRINSINSSISQIDYQLSKHTRQNSSELLELKVFEFFTSLLLSKYKILIFNKEKNELKTSLNKKKKLIKRKDVTQLESLTHRAEIDFLETKISQEEQNYLESLKNLISVSGINVNNKIITRISQIPKSINLIENGLEDFSLSSKDTKKILHHKANSNLVKGPGWKEILLQEQLSVEAAHRVTSSDWPELSFKGSVTEEYGRANDLGSTTTILGLYLTIPFNLGGKVFSNLKEKTYEIEVAKRKAESSRHNLRNEIHTDINRIKQLKSLIQSNEKLIKSRTKILNLTTVGYKYKQITIKDLLDRRTQYYESKISLFENKIELVNLVKKVSYNLAL